MALILIAAGYAVFINLSNSSKNASNSSKDVLSLTDLNKPSTQLNSKTSDASVNNLTHELKAKIDEQIAAKQNPFETVDQLAAVLASTTNKTRQDQLTIFIEDFLGKHEDALWFTVDSQVTDQAQVNYWKAGLYARLVYNYRLMMLNEFVDSKGMLIDTTKDQLKYVNLYLALANDPASHSRATEEYKNAPVGYPYDETDTFLQLRNTLMESGK